MLGCVIWERVSALVTGRRSWVIAVAIALLSGAFMALIGANSAASQSPVLVPPSSDSARAAEALRQFSNGDRASAILVITRTDGSPLTPADLVIADEARYRMQTVPEALPGASTPVIESADGNAATATVSLSTDLSGFALTDAVKALRTAAADGLPPQLTSHVTGGPAFGGDIANAFSGANVTLLVVTALVVALLLIATYRSPILWLVPLTVIGLADRVATAVGTAVAEATGLTFDGATSGITSVLVFGAGTNYALLLISRYREELRKHTDHRTALRAAVRAAGPAIVASNATVVLALLTLILAVIPSTRSLGACAACGLVVAAVFVLLVLPPLLALCGRRVFWPFIPGAGTAPPTTAGVWHRVAHAVGSRPGPVCAVAITVLAMSTIGLLGTHIGLSQTEQFRIRADSVTGFDTLAAHFPGGAASASPPATERQGVCVRFVGTDCSLAKRSSRPFTYPPDQNEASSGLTASI